MILQRAGGAFADPQAFVGGILNDVVIRDFSGDGRFDLGVAGTIGGRAGVHVLLQSSSRVHLRADPASPIVTGSIEAIVVGRLDAGTTADIAASRPGDDQVVIRLGKRRRRILPAGPSRVSPGDNPGLWPPPTSIETARPTWSSRASTRRWRRRR